MNNRHFRSNPDEDSAESEETFLDDYRSHRGLPSIPRKRSRFEPDDDFKYFHNADYGDHYVERKEESFFESMKNFFSKGPKE